MKSDIQIREMMIDDYEAVFKLWNGMEGIGLSASDEPEQIEAYLHRNLGLSLVAVCRATLIGAVLCGHDGRRGYIHHLAIHPGYRSRGIGTRMVQDCLKHLTTLGIQKCHIFLIPGNQKGSEFWSRAGFHFRDDLALMSIDLE